MSEKRLLPPKTGDLSDWYTTIIQLADLADYGPAKGTMIIKPYGYAIWEMVQKAMDPMIKARGVGNAYFPLFIPMNLLEKEANHVEGFAPELAVVTHGGGEKLEESLAVRPTSETIMYNSFAKWVESWRDLPIMMNQWNNVVRWEKRTMPFLRTSEFLWQEGHTAHATHDEAVELQKWAMETYAAIYKDYFAIDGNIGFKSASERFAGADTTLTYESLMPSGKALQACTSHDLGQNFSKTFNISFQDKGGQENFAWQTSWGLSTRSIGGLILVHGDDNGLRLPPKLAPIQIIIVPVKPDEKLIEYCSNINDRLTDAGIRSEIDSRDDESFGFRLNKAEVKGIPIILKVGDKEMQAGTVTAKRRFDGHEDQIGLDNIDQELTRRLDQIQTMMFEASKQYLAENTRDAKDYEEFKAIMNEHKGFIRVFWQDDKDIEKKIKAEQACRDLAGGRRPRSRTSGRN